MKHAGKLALEALEPLLRQLRANPALVERTAGSFYKKGSAYLHFHEDPAGLFADVKLNARDFERFRVSTAEEQERMATLIAENLNPHLRST